MNSTIPNLAKISALTLAGGVASAAVIDDFTQGAVLLQATNYTGHTLIQSGLSISAVIGGSRSLYVGSLALATVQIDSLAGQFQFTADSSFGYFTLQYGANGPLRANLRADGSDRFLVNIYELTPGLWRGIFDFDVVTGSGSYTYDFSRDLFALNGPGQMVFPFSRFPGADFSNVEAIKIDVARFEPGFHIGLDSITTVPEPSVFAIFALTLPLMIGNRRFCAKQRAGPVAFHCSAPPPGALPPAAALSRCGNGVPRP